jgi:hypothetical protein
MYLRLLAHIFPVFASLSLCVVSCNTSSSDRCVGCDGMWWGCVQTSDFRHNVITPALLLLCESLSRCGVRGTRDVTCALFVCALVLQFTADSARYFPELIAMLQALPVVAFALTPTAAPAPASASASSSSASASADAATASSGAANAELPNALGLPFGAGAQIWCSVFHTKHFPTTFQEPTDSSATSASAASTSSSSAAATSSSAAAAATSKAAATKAQSKKDAEKEKEKHKEKEKKKENEAEEDEDDIISQAAAAESEFLRELQQQSLPLTAVSAAQAISAPHEARAAHTKLNLSLLFESSSLPANPKSGAALSRSELDARTALLHVYLALVREAAARYVSVPPFAELFTPILSALIALSPRPCTAPTGTNAFAQYHAQQSAVEGKLAVPALYAVPKAGATQVVLPPSLYDRWVAVCTDLRQKRITSLRARRPIQLIKKAVALKQFTPVCCPSSVWCLAPFFSLCPLACCLRRGCRRMWRTTAPARTWIRSKRVWRPSVWARNSNARRKALCARSVATPNSLSANGGARKRRRRLSVRPNVRRSAKCSSKNGRTPIRLPKSARANARESRCYCKLSPNPRFDVVTLPLQLNHPLNPSEKLVQTQAAGLEGGVTNPTCTQARRTEKNPESLGPRPDSRGGEKLTERVVPAKPESETRDRDKLHKNRDMAIEKCESAS